jgi:hypothetical protein
MSDKLIGEFHFLSLGLAAEAALWSHLSTEKIKSRQSKVIFRLLQWHVMAKNDATRQK